MTTANWALSARSGMPPSPVTTAGSANWPTRRSQPKGTTTSGVAKAKAKADKEAEKIDALIAEGWDPDEAESEVTRESVESIRKRNFLMRQRRFGHVRRSRPKGLLDEVAYPQYLRAESATRGNMVKAHGSTNARSKPTRPAPRRGPRCHPRKKEGNPFLRCG